MIIASTAFESFLSKQGLEYNAMLSIPVKQIRQKYRASKQSGGSETTSLQSPNSYAALPKALSDSPKHLVWLLIFVFIRRK